MTSDPEGSQRVRELRAQLLEELAGICLEQMLTSTDPLSWFLHSSHRVRIAALMLVGKEWAPKTQFRAICEWLSVNDPNPQVRGVALTTVGSCYASTNDQMIGQVLAGIVSNEEEPVECRLSAYCALLDVFGVLVLEEVESLDWVDWGFVRRCGNPDD